MRGVGPTLPWVAALACVGTASRAAERAGVNAVDVVLVGSDEQVGTMRAVTKELLARLGIAANITSAPGVDPAEVINPRPDAEPRIARAWIDLSRPERATLYLVDREWERVLIRHLEKTPGHEEVAREAIGHILETAVDALLHGARIGIVREDAEREMGGPLGSLRETPTPTTTSATADMPPRLHLQGGLEYEAAIYAPGVVTQGPGGTFLLAAGGAKLRPALWVTGQYRLPLSVDAHPLGVRLDGGAVRALATLEATVSERVSVRLGVGAGVDVVHLAPRSEGGSGVSPAADKTFAVAVARASAGLGFALSPHVVTVAALSCDLDPSDTRYVTLVNGSAVPALTARTLRPALSLGVELR